MADGNGATPDLYLAQEEPTLNEGMRIFRDQYLV
jgi:hypothetical protein